MADDRLGPSVTLRWATIAFALEVERATLISGGALVTWRQSAS